jgi:hypothetical protein
MVACQAKKMAACVVDAAVLVAAARGRRPALTLAPALPQARAVISARAASIDQSTGSASPNGASAASSAVASRLLASASARGSEAIGIGGLKGHE